VALVLITAGGAALAAGPQPQSPMASAPAAPSDPFSDALDKANLNDQQKAQVEQIGKQVGDTQQAAGKAGQDLTAALADQIKSGNVDANALNEKVDALAKASDDAARASRKSMDDLHRLLTPQQRAAFADSMENSIKQAQPPPQPSGASPVDQLAKDLGLSNDQKQRIQAVFSKQQQAQPPSQQDRDAQIGAFEAFKKDDYSADKAMPSVDVRAQTRKDADQRIAMYKDIAAILTPDQRQKLASEMTSPPPAAKMG
jgi:Spy/CpxP family protein refolding chaperone